MTDYNLFEPKIIDFIQKALSNENFQNAFLDLIKAFNPSLVDLFTFVEGGKRIATIYGLLMASLMTGNVMKNIAVKFLEAFKKKYNENP